MIHNVADLLNRLQAALGDTYHIEHELGGGGMSRVFLAQETALDRRVVIKVLPPEMAAGVSVERFRREIQLAASLQHPHIVPLLTAGSSGDLLYYIMPCVEGEPLRAKLAREGALSIGEAVRILRDIVDALAHAHAHGVVHRDIKPENVLIARKHAMVTDFGVAKAVTASTGGASLTSVGVALGTPAYMAPEQAAADPRVDHRADLYAVGVVGYEVVCGRPPFIGATPQATLAAQVTQVPEPVTTHRPSVPGALSALIMRCLEKHPADRWENADELLHQLEAMVTPGGGVTPTATAAAGRESTVPPASAARPWEHRHALADRTFQLTEGICRKLNRATLDSRIIGDHLHYLDNQVESDVLVCYLHGLLLDQSNFAHILEILPYRGLAPTMYGLEPEARRRITLSLDDHIVLIREFLQTEIKHIAPRVTVLVGFSTGADFGFRLLAATPPEELPRIDGFLSLGCNLTLETCFVSSILARLSSHDPARLLADLRSVGNSARSLSEWVNVHEYLVRVFRKFQRDTEVLVSLAREIVQPFESGEPSASPHWYQTFPRWYRKASAVVKCLRCVFADTEADNRAVQQLKLASLDSGVLGPQHREDSIVIQVGAHHFQLIDTALHRQHLEAMLGALA